MSDDAHDFNTGAGIASGGGSPDWNNPNQVAGYYSQKNYETTQAEMNPPPSPTNYNNNNTSNDWMSGGSPSDYSSSGTYSSGRYSGRSSSQDINLTSSDVVTGLGLLLGGYAGYSFAVANHGTTQELWLTTGGAAFVTAFVIHLLVEVIKGKMLLSVAVVTVVILVSGFVSGVLGYWYAEARHGSTVELWLAAALAAFGGMFVSASVTEAFKGNLTLFALGAMLAMALGGYAGHTYYDGTPLQDWLAAGVSALAVGFCAWVIEEIISNAAGQQPTKGLTAKTAKR